MKRDFTKPEENKQPDSAGLRRNKPKEPEEGGSFSRGNFRSKREEEAAPKRDGPPRFSRGGEGEKRGGGGGAAGGESGTGFGFRSNAAARGKK